MRQFKTVMYHYVRELANGRYPGIKGLEYEKFKRQIAYLSASRGRRRSSGMCSVR